LILSIEIPGQPVPKHRPRIVKGWRMINDPRSTEHEELIRRYVIAEKRRVSLCEGPVSLSVEFFLAPPASWSGKKKQQAYDGIIRPTSRPDLDNYIKMVMDALNGIVWKDDAQVVSIEASKCYYHTGYTRIWVTEE
jgi:Holliday junction resolvase RusA-like endonuclease